MRSFLKKFLLTLMSAILITGVSAYAYIQYHGERKMSENVDEAESLKLFGEERSSSTKKDRINAIFLGIDGERTDTIIFGSYDVKNNKLDLISIPRDTYYESGHKGAGAKKVNAIYPLEGIEGTIRAIEDILQGIDGEINYYAKIDYDGVKNIVDSVGGVDIDVPINMRYSDPYSKPALDINIEKGYQNLKGQKAVDFLRYRKGYVDGDVGRVKAQQMFIKSFIDKALSPKLPLLIKSFIEEVTTNMGVSDAAYYSTKIMNLKAEDINMYVLPGKGEYKTVEGESLSYFVIDYTKLDELLKTIFSNNSTRRENINEYNVDNKESEKIQIYEKRSNEYETESSNSNVVNTNNGTSNSTKQKPISEIKTPTKNNNTSTQAKPDVKLPEEKTEGTENTSDEVENSNVEGQSSEIEVKAS